MVLDADISKFISYWNGRGYEKGESQTFWLAFLRDVLKVSEPEQYVKFEVPVKLEHTKFIDVFFPDSKVIVEQKSIDKNLDSVNAYEQALKYINGLPLSMHPHWIITCNFKEFLIYDMETLSTPTKILLTELPQTFHFFDFLIDNKKSKIRIELELSLKAGEVVGKIYDALYSQYFNPTNIHSLQSLNKLCVRLVFCLYAESTGIFGKHKLFYDYLNESRNIRRDLIDLFSVLNTPIEQRDHYLLDDLKSFPYVNGGLFADEDIEIPNFTDEIKNLLLEEASGNFNWSGISPTIFGAVFESTLNSITRRFGGMHYTSIENIHKVIDPLFLDDLRTEFQAIKGKKKLLAFQKKIAALKFFDPACGSGNFLTESFISLRRLENEVLRELFGEQILLGAFVNPVKVSIQQFYGIEINDFAVAVAKTALWIAELQMLQETQEIIHRDLDFLPLKSYANIHEGNALRMNWKEIIPSDINFIMGNPPFIGASMLNAAQKNDAVNIFGKTKLSNSIDYVGAWYHITANLISGTKIKATFVSTNSITQGEQVDPLWNKILNLYHCQIIFAYKTFRWDSESTQKAAVHCVIIAFADNSLPVIKKIFDGDNVQIVENISPYLIDADNILISSRSKPICAVPSMTHGNKPTDDGNFIWCQPTDKQKIAIELTAQNILDVRKNYPDATLADLYDPLTMPKDLRDAHKENDNAVLTAYGFDLTISESEIVTELFKLYNKISKI